MPINFAVPEHITQQMEMVKMAAEYSMRPVSRELDEHEHERPTQFVETMWPFMRDMTQATLKRVTSGEGDKPRDPNRPRTTNLRLMLMIEILSWGDAGIYLCLPGGSLGGAAIEATGTPEQKVKFLTRFAEGDTPAWGAMAMTEPGAGSDTSSIRTTATFDDATNEWIINGEKIFCTNGKLALDESNGLVVVWASIDRSAGRAGMRPFVVEAGTPGV
jgi:acyl-CoA dehydrogenase